MSQRKRGKDFYRKIEKTNYLDWTLEDFQKKEKLKEYKMKKKFNEIKKFKRNFYANWTLEECIKYYEENYLGKGRMEVMELNSQFYKTIKRLEYLDKIIPKKTNRELKNLDKKIY